MKFYVYNIEESCKEAIIGHLGNSGTADLLLHIVLYWSACEADEEKWSLPMVLYCSDMMYTYYYRLGFYPIKNNEEGKNIHNEIFNNIPHFIKKFCMLIVFNMFLNIQG